MDTIMLMFFKRIILSFVIVGIGKSLQINRFIPNLVLYTLPVMLLLMKMIFLGKTESIGLLVLR